MRFKRLATVCLAALGSFVCSSALAAGFYLSEVGTPGSLGSGGVINPTNTFGADSAWTNPAGMTGLEKDAMLAGMQIAGGSVKFDADIGPAGDNGGNAVVLSPIPSFFYVRKLSDRARFGFSAVAPLGGGFDFGNNFVGRYVVTETTLAGVGFTPSFAYRVNDRLSLGAGLSLVYTLFEQDIALRQPGFPDGKIKLEDLDDWGVQGILGLTYELTDRTLLGVVYRSEADTELEGDIKLEGVQGAFSAQADLGVDWKNPQWLEFGLRHELTNDINLFFNAGWQEWSAFSQNRFAINAARDAVVEVDRQFDNTWHGGIAIAKLLGNGAAMTLGFGYDSSPVDDEHRTLDLPFDEIYKLSAAYVREGKGKFDYSIGGTLFFIGDGAVDQTLQGVRVAGEFDTNVLLFLGATLRYEF